jgi:hypothetical protein
MLIERLIGDAAEPGSFSGLVERIVSSRQFRYRRPLSQDAAPPLQEGD